MKDIIIIGSGGLAKEIAQYIRDINVKQMQWNLLGFSTNDSTMLNVVIGNNIVVTTDSELESTNRPISVVIGLGSPQLISSLKNRFMKHELINVTNLFHPNAYLSNRVTVNRGNIIAPGCVISVDVKIGSCNLFNWNCTIGHDTIIGDCNVLNPSCNVSGSVTIGSRVLIGTGAQILQGLTVCDDAVIGAGAVVTRDITESGVYVGIPARQLSPRLF